MATISLRDYIDKLDSLASDNHYDAVIFHCQHILQTYPRNIATYLRYGQALVEESQWDSAREILLRVLNVIPDDGGTHQALSDVYLHMRRYDDAIWHLERAYEQDPNNEAILNKLTELYREYREIENPQFHLTAASAAKQYARNKLYPQAVDVLTQAIQQTPRRGDLRLLLARIYAEMGRPVESAETALDVLQAFPDCLEANIIMARFWMDEQRPSDAQRYLSRIEPVNPYLAVKLVQGQEPPHDTFELSEGDYETAAHRELTQNRPDWLSQLGEGDEAVEDFTALDIDEDLLGDLDADLDEDALAAFAEANADDLPDNWLDIVEEFKDRSDEETVAVDMSDVPREAVPEEQAVAEIEDDDPFGLDDIEPLPPSRTRKKTGLTGLLSTLGGDDEDDEPELQQVDEADDFDFEMEQSEGQTAEEAGVSLTGLFDDLPDSEDEDVDPLAWTQESGIELLDEDEEAVATPNVPSSDADDPLAWMQQSGVEFADEDNQAAGFSELEVDALQDPEDIDPMAWMYTSGIEVIPDDEDTDSPESDDEEDADPLAWMQESGIELLDEDDESSDAQPDIVEEFMAEIEETSEEDGWLDDDSILDEMLDMEALTFDEEVDTEDEFISEAKDDVAEALEDDDLFEFDDEEAAANEDDFEFDEITAEADEDQEDFDLDFEEGATSEDTDFDDMLAKDASLVGEEELDFAAEFIGEDEQNGQDTMTDDFSDWLDSDSEDDESSNELDWLASEAFDSDETVPADAVEFGILNEEDEEAALDWMTDDPDDDAVAEEDEIEFDWSAELDDEDDEQQEDIMATFENDEEPFAWSDELEPEDAASDKNEEETPNWLGEFEDDSDQPAADLDDEETDFEQELEAAPDWLNEVEFDDETTGFEDDLPGADELEDTTPDWLGEIQSEEEEEFATEGVIAEFDELETSNDEAPAWLDDIQEDSFSDEEVVPVEELEFGEDDDEDDFDIDEFISEATIEEGEDEAVVAEFDEMDDFDLEFEDEEAPVLELTDDEDGQDIADMLDFSEEEDFVAEAEDLTEFDDDLGFITGDVEVEADAAPNPVTSEFDEEDLFEFENAEAASESEDTPDWLSDIGVDDEDEPSDFEEEFDFVAEVETDSEGEDEFELDFDFDDADDEEELVAEDAPDWLSDIGAGDEEDDASFDSEDEEFEFVAEVDADDEEETFDFDFDDEDEQVLATDDVPDWLAGISAGDEEEAPVLELTDDEDDISFDSEDDEEFEFVAEAEVESDANEFELDFDFDEEDDQEELVAEDAPDWLAGIGVEVADSDDASPLDEDDELEFELETLDDYENEDEFDSQFGEEFELDLDFDDEEEDEYEEEAVAEVDVPDWLQDAQPAAEVELEPKPIGAEDTGHTPADNAPDWLNAMAPGFDVDYEAQEDAPIEQEFLAEHESYTSDAAYDQRDDGRDNFDWLTDIVEEEVNQPPEVRPDAMPGTAAAAPVPTAKPRFRFSRLPAWIIGTATTQAAAPAMEADLEFDDDFEEFGDDLPDWLDFDDEPFGDN